MPELVVPHKHLQLCLLMAKQVVILTLAPVPNGSSEPTFHLVSWLWSYMELLLPWRTLYFLL